MADSLGPFVPALGGPYDTVHVREWTDADGLPTPVMNITHAPDGSIWATTEQGVARFDGQSFRVFTDANTPALATSDLLGLFVTDDGDVWVGDRERRAYRYRDGTWRRFDLDAALTKGRWVRGFAEGADGTIWAATGQGSVARFDGERWTAHSQRIRNRWSPLVADGDGTVWTLLPDNRVARWTGERFEAAPGFADIVHADATADGLVVQRRRGTAEDGRGLFDVFDLQGTMLGSYASDVPMIVRLVDRAGRLWLHPRETLRTGQLYVVDGEEVVYAFAPAGTSDLEGVVEDAHGSVWITARNRGLFRLSATAFDVFQSEVPSLTMVATASVTPDGSVVVSPQQRRSGTHIATIGRAGMAMDAFQIDVSALDNPRHARDGLVRAGHVIADPSGQRWGVAGSLVLRFTGERAGVAAQAPDLVTATFSDRAGEVWVGTRGGQMGRLDVAAGALTVTDAISDEVWAIRRTADGRLWAGGDRGLAVQTPDGGWQVVTDTLSVRALHEEPDGTLWMTTNGQGLVRLKDGDARALRIGDGLPTERLSLLLVDRLGFAWIGAGRALLRLRLADASGFLDGIGPPPSVTSIPASAGHGGVSRWARRASITDDGALWVPSMRGIARIDPVAFAHQHAVAAPVLVDAIRTEDGTAFHPAEGLELPPGARQVEIDYTATDLLAPDLVRFRTRLDGHDDGWVDRGAERQVTYGGLGPGAYTLHVQAMNASGAWGEAVAAPAFVVPPRAWETWPFRGLALLALGGLLAVAYSGRVRSLTERQRVLGALVAERTADLEAEKETVAAQARDLASLNEAKTRLFANVSHEFRTPLTLTLGPLDDVLSEMHGPITPQTRAQLHLARRNADRVLDLVEQILDVSRMESGEMELVRQALDLGSFVETLAEGVRPLADRKAIDLSVSVPAGPTPVSADPVLVEKALANLISNALKFTPAGGTVRVSLSATDGAASVSVRDSGPGIPEADLPHVFDRFYQAARSDRPAEPGTGIGLALAREVADLHGGLLAVESEEGFGSLFTLSLPFEAVPEGALVTPTAPPVAALSEAVAQPPSDDGTTADRTTVLVVEDHGDVRAHVRQHLAPEYRVLEAVDGVEGLECARAHLPDLVLSDLMMPRMDGIALCQALKADPDTAFIPVVLLTARAAVEDRLGGLDSGADDYLTKPFDVRELKARVENLIAGRRRLRDLLAEPPRGDGALRATTIEAVSSDDVFLSAVRDAIEAHLSDEAFSVERLAREVGVSRAHLYRQLRDLDGRSPSEIIRTLRLERAAQLLEAGAGTVSEVAYAVGFKSVSHFSNTFAAHVGCRPSVYPESA
ncbi:MAG: ATP-binding protein [Bacteroidota bacterium]